MLESDKRLLNTTLISVAILLTYSLSSCKNGKSISQLNPSSIKNIFTPTSYEVNEVMQAVLSNKDTVAFETDTFVVNQVFSKLYDSASPEPLWISGNELSANGLILKKLLDSVSHHGLNPKMFWQDSLIKTTKLFTKNPTVALATQTEKLYSIIAYKLANSLQHGYYKPGSFTDEYYNQIDSQFNAGTTIKKLIEKDSLQFMSQALEPKTKLYKQLKLKLAQLSRIKDNGGWTTGITLKDSIANEKDDPQIAILRKRLFKEMGTPSDTISTKMDDALLAEIKKFQYLYDIKITGKLDTGTVSRLNRNIDQQINIVKTNLERCRWLRNQFQQPYVWVNVPRMELSYFNQDSLQYQMRVVVGRIGRPTPTLDAPMTNLVINPGWSVPPTIMEQEIIPGIAKRGGSYLARRGLKAFLGGREINPSVINAKNYKRYTVQQKPGLNSSLGVVKFNLPNRHAIYLHDTPHREDFVKYYRAYSSGCIRVHHPREFAAFLLNDSNYTKPKIDSFARTRITKEVKLKRNIDVHIVYITNDLDSLGNLKYLRDIYNYDKNFSKAWN